MGFYSYTTAKNFIQISELIVPRSLSSEVSWKNEIFRSGVFENYNSHLFDFKVEIFFLNIVKTSVPHLSQKSIISFACSIDTLKPL